MSRKMASRCKEEKRTYYCLCRDDEVVLWHVSSTIDLAIVIDALDDFNLALVPRLETTLFLYNDEHNGDITEGKVMSANSAHTRMHAEQRYAHKAWREMA